MKKPLVGQILIISSVIVLSGCVERTMGDDVNKLYACTSDGKCLDGFVCVFEKNQMYAMCLPACESSNDCTTDRYCDDSLAEKAVCVKKVANGEQCAEGATGTMHDKAGTSYPTVCINGQFWMARNMDYATGTLGTNYFYPNGNADNRSMYGLLYPWSTATNICPPGWRLPSWTDFDNLLTYVSNNRSSSSNFFALIARSTAWTDYSNQGLDEFGFGGLPAGSYYSGDYNYFGSIGLWWSSTEYNSSDAYYLYLGYGNATVNDYNKTYGTSVRCLKDSN